MTPCVSRLRLAAVAAAVCLACSVAALRLPDAVVTEADVDYGEAGGQKLLLDVFRPAIQNGPAPAVLIIHGGGWAGGDKKEPVYRQMAETLARAGYVVFNANYRLARNGTNRYPAALDDVQRAVRWIRANAGRYDVAPRRIGALGASAGGHLAALLGTRETRDNSDRQLARHSSKVQCVVDVFGPADFTVRDGQPLNPAAIGILMNFLGKTPQEAPDLYREASPVAHVDRGDAPFLIFHGDRDMLVPIDQSRRLHAALQKAGVPSELVVMQGEGHGFARRENQERFAAASLAFFDRHLRGGRAAR